MNAKSIEVVRKHLITRDPFPNSKKIYVNGTIHEDVRVAMREISCSDTFIQGRRCARKESFSIGLRYWSLHRSRCRNRCLQRSQFLREKMDQRSWRC